MTRIEYRQKEVVRQFGRLQSKGLTVVEAKQWLKQNWPDYLDTDDLNEIEKEALKQTGRE